MKSEYKHWISYLERKLFPEEVNIIDNMMDEKEMNKNIENIHNLASDHNLYIPQLPKLDGNCFFESLKYHGLCDNIEEFRVGLAYILLLLRNEKYFIPQQEMSLEELFNLRNEIVYVFCHNEKKLYKYDYYCMCIDLASNNSWSRLHTELIITVLSIIFNVRFSIMHENGYNSIIEQIHHDHDTTPTIHLALMGEVHYLPLETKKQNQYEYDFPIFRKYKDAYDEWSTTMINKKTEIIKRLNKEKNEIFNELNTEIDNNLLVDFFD